MPIESPYMTYHLMAIVKFPHLLSFMSYSQNSKILNVWPRKWTSSSKGRKSGLIRLQMLLFFQNLWVPFKLRKRMNAWTNGQVDTGIETGAGHRINLQANFPCRKDFTKIQANSITAKQKRREYMIMLAENVIDPYLYTFWGNKV